MSKQDILFRTKKKKAFGLLKDNRFEEAGILLDQLCKASRQDPDLWCALGVVNGRLGRYPAAVDCCQRAVALAPRDTQAQYNLGVALRDAGQLDAAVGPFRTTLMLDPANRAAGSSLGHLLLTLGRVEEAEAVFKKVLAVHPQDPQFLNDLGTTLQLMGSYDAAISYYRRSLQINPNLVLVYDNLAAALVHQGRLQEAMECYREALRRDPNDTKVYSNYLFTLHYHPQMPREEMLKEHQRWPGTQPSSKIVSRPLVDANPARRLKIGYVSSDFRTHSVSYFFEPLLQAHDNNAVEVYCYAGGQRADATTVRLQGLAHAWRDIGAMTDAQAAEQIAADGIDILVDLNGHTAQNRLRVFARKPAPIQVTYLGYPDTTGLATIDYRITDAWSDPPGDEVYYTEKLIRLEGCFLCYRPPDDAPAVAVLPASERGFITFGSFNARAKINEEVIKLWSRLLLDIPASRLLIKNPSLTCPVTRDRLHEQFVAQGIAPERVELRGLARSTQEHLATYAHIDIALDTFPYNGTTTTCEALWMGVPVITLAGDAHIGRVGLSLLHAIGQEDLISRNRDEYLHLAMNLAGDRTRLANLRAELRPRMAASPLCDAQAFARKIEASYRTMWYALITNQPQP